MRILRQIHAGILTRLLPISSISFLLSKILAFSALSPIGSIDYAGNVFAQIPNPNVFSYNCIIRGCFLGKNPSKEPFNLLKKMVKRGYPNANSFTLAFVLKACSIVMDVEEGKQVHARVLRSGFGLNPFVQTSLVNFYSRCGEIRIAKKVFDEISDRNVVSWSAIISGHARLGMVNEAFNMFREMLKVGIEPDEVSLGSVITACAMSGALDVGRWIHAYIRKQIIHIDLELSTALVNMYAKCGCIEQAKEIFDEMTVKDSKAWSSMIVGLAINGLAEDALDVFSQMQEAKVQPNHVTFVGILSACAHGGLVSEACNYWSRMLELGIEQTKEHYGCMVNLLCQGGLMDEAYNFVDTLPSSPDPVIWRTLLVGCKKDSTMHRAEIVAERLLELEPLNAENYMILADLYASFSFQEKMSHVRKMMKERGIKVVPGRTSIEVDGFVHVFVMGEWSHPEAQDIKGVLRDVSVRIRKFGHEPRIFTILHNANDREKADDLSWHSVKVAIAYGLLKTKEPAAIRIVKDRRVCADCHEVTKIISKIYERKIIVRDRAHLHKFVDGKCSCKDNW